MARMFQVDTQELISLQQEFQWLLRQEVDNILKQLHGIVKKCIQHFNISFQDVDIQRAEKFTLTNPKSNSDNITAVVTLASDHIIHADLGIKLPKPGFRAYKTVVHSENQWKLHQIQDAGNHLAAALNLLTPEAPDGRFSFKTADEVIQMANLVMGYLLQGKESLVMPRRKTIDDIRNSNILRNLDPPLPGDLALSFYVQSHVLVFAVYQIQKDAQGKISFDTHQVESPVPWLYEAVVLLMIALQLCQQLIDKINVINQQIFM